MTQVLIKRLDPTVPMPSYAKGGDAGADLATRIDFTIKPGERMLIPTGISIALPNGYVALVHPRSGLAIKHGISMVNTPGTVDAGFRGELQVILINHDLTESVSFKKGVSQPGKRNNSDSGQKSHTESSTQQLILFIRF